MKKISSIVSLIAAFVLSFGLLIFPTTTDAESNSYDYLALGDSLAAGVLSDGETIGSGYTDYLAQRLEEVGVLGGFNKNFATPGYTTTDVLADINANVERPNVSGENVTIQSEIANADIITISAGANDVLGSIDINPEDYTVSFEQQDIVAAITKIGENTAKIVGTIKTVNNPPLSSSCELT